MPRLVEATPKYRCHRASGQAVVTIQGHDFYLGPWNSKASKVEYDRTISEWLAAGRQLSVTLGGASDLTVVEVLARYKKFAIQHYRKDGVVTREWDNIQDAIEPLQRLYGRTPVQEFGPLLDQDAVEDARAVRDAIRNSRQLANGTEPVVIASLPSGRKDPGECSHAEVWRAVKRALRRR